jgi:hypothetical protein
VNPAEKVVWALTGEPVSRKRNKTRESKFAFMVNLPFFFE